MNKMRLNVWLGPHVHYIHRQGCAHGKPRDATGDPVTIEATSKQMAVETVLADGDGQNWEDYEINWGSCTRPLLRERPAREGELEDDGVIHAEIDLGRRGKVLLKQGRSDYIIVHHMIGGAARRIAKGRVDAMLSALPAIITEVRNGY